MPTIAEGLALPEREGAVARAERLLRTLHKVFSHDLPNETVVLQSLLQLLSLEEAECLSENGREYLGRLQNAARRASDLARFLKEIARLNAFASRAEPVALEPLGRELQGELQRLHPGHAFTFAWHWDVPELNGDARVFLQAILELFAGLLQPQGSRCQVQACARPWNGALAWTFEFEETPGVVDRPASSPPRGLDEKLEIILAREWLALCGAEVNVARQDAARACFTITLPGR